MPPGDRPGSGALRPVLPPGPLMRLLPVFPLGTVLVPGAVLPLHVFEPRYRALMADLDAGGPAPAEFGVVLISRGSEVGGGDLRLTTGTLARVLEATELPDGRWVLAVVGTSRFRVQRWLPDDPYPRAEACELAEPDDVAGLGVPGGPLRRAEVAVRRALRLAAEIEDSPAPFTFSLATDPAEAAWQLVAALPVGAHDRQRLLEEDRTAERLALTARMAEDLAEMLALRLARGQ